MKKLLLIALLAFIIAGCSKKSNPSPTVTSITGKWYATIDTTKEYVNGTLQTTTPTTYNHTNFVQFNADNTGSSLTDGIPDTFTYSLSGTTLTLNFSAQTVGVITYAAYSEKATVRTLTANTLVVYEDDTDVSGGETDRTTEVQYLTR